MAVKRVESAKLVLVSRCDTGTNTYEFEDGMCIDLDARAVAENGLAVELARYGVILVGRVILSRFRVLSGVRQHELTS